jgi:hypothetical protein
MATPAVNKFGLESGREATCLHEILSAVSSSSSPSPETYYYRDLLASQLMTRLVDWIEAGDDTDERVISDCAGKLSYLPQRLRVERIRGPSLTESELSSLSALGDEVWPLRLNPDGTLQVRHIPTDREMTLAADYLW